MIPLSHWALHPQVKCWILLVFLVHRACSVDLCTDGISDEVLSAGFHRDVMPVGGVSAGTFKKDSSAPTPVDCVRSCCRAGTECEVIFFFNGTCFLVRCNRTDPTVCDPTSAKVDQFAGSYWLRLHPPLPPTPPSDQSLTLTTDISADPSAVVDSTPSLKQSDSFTNHFTSLLFDFASDCNISDSSECDVNERCVLSTTAENKTRYRCDCVDGFTRDSLTGTCINSDAILNQPTTATSSLSVDNGGGSSSTTTPPSMPIYPLSTVTTLVESLVVSAGQDRIIQWPENEITVNAFVLHKDQISSEDYKYQWFLTSHPDGDETGEMVDINSASLKLSKLRLGMYTFKVEVTSEEKYGMAFVNITVLPPARENQSPVAVIKPSSQEVNQPNDVVIDGSGSTDDDKIVSYEWDEVSGPVDSQRSIETSELNKPTLVLKSLGPGSYRFKLTVTDSDGVQNATYADAIVIKETDYPPKANAGSNIIVNLPQTSVTLFGNASQDDKGIVSYEWTKKSDDKLTADMLGVRTAFLQLANLQVGDYTFTLTVTDTAKQTSSADVHVFVKPEHNQPPVARTEIEKIVWLPGNVLSLDGSNSTDDQKIVSYAWTFISGPSSVVVENADQPITTVSNLVVGEYKFKLTVKDNEGLESSSQVVVTVKENPNRPPVAKAGGDLVVVLPTPLVVINGSLSSDDKGIVSYIWTREKNSPAAGDVVPSSDHQPVLQLVNVVSGRYGFTLEVSDAEGLTSHDSVSLLVKPDPHELNLVELHLTADVSSFSETNKETLKEQLSLLLHKGSTSGDTNIVIQRLMEDISSKRTLVVFYVESTNAREILPADDVVSALKKLRSNLEILDFRIVKFQPAVCQNNCSGHGICDQSTHGCICDGFWMEDLFRSYFGEQESNCDWSVLYVVIIVFFVVVAVGLIFWGIVCFCKRCRCSYWKPKLKRHRSYTVMEQPLIEDTTTKFMEQVELLPKARSLQNSSLMQSDSELSSDDTLFVNNKRKTNGFVKKSNNNGSIKQNAEA